MPKQEIIATGGSHIQGVIQTIPAQPKPSDLREWWHMVLRNYNKFSCYSIFLVLPSDKEAVHYLTEFGNELGLISGNNCLVIALSQNEYQRCSLDEKLWKASIQEQISEGYSVRIAQLFDIDFSEFPCLIVFQDIRASEHVKISLKRMTAEEIAEKMRVLFSIIQKAVSDKQSPLTEIENQRNVENLTTAGKTIISEIRSFAGKTFETAVESWIKASIK